MEKAVSKKPKKKKRGIHEITAENDIKFRGPLSYRHLRIIGWVFLAIAQIGTILKFGESVYNNPGMYGAWPQILTLFRYLMAPLFLIAIFGVVLNGKSGYKRLIIMYGGLAVLIYLLALFAFEHYIVGFLSLSVGYQAAQQSAEKLAQSLVGNGFFSFNMFIDLLLCTLVTFFINYRPTKYFQGKKIYIFRALVVLPILYEIASVFLKILASTGNIQLSVFVFPLLTTKPPFSFLIFVMMALFIKFRERFFIKKGKTHEDFKEFQKTNINSLHFSIFLVISIVVAAIVDLVVFISVGASMLSKPMPAGMTEELYIAYTFQTVESWGIGQSVYLILIIPLVILFDYQKTYEDTKIDSFIPVAGIGLVAFVTIEGGYDVLRQFLYNISTIPETPPESNASELIRYAVRAVTKK